MSNELQNISAAKIAAMKDIKTVVAVKGMAEAANVFYRAQDAWEQAQLAQEYRLRAIRQAGEILQGTPRGKGNQHSSALSTKLTKQIEEAGISRETANTWQKVARVPDSTFEAYFPEAEYRGDEFTIAGLMKHSGMWLGRSDTAEWETPDELFQLLNKEFSFDVDVCASKGNAKVDPYYDEETNGLTQEWGERTCWMNPPYGREIPKWMDKASQEVKDNGALVVCLVPARTDTDWWWRNAIRGEVRFLRGRLKFSGQSGAPFPSAVVVLGREIDAGVVWWNEWAG